MTIIQTEVEQGLKQLGLGKGDKVLVHSSMKSLGYIEGGADAVINAFLNVLGEEGAFIVPTLTGKFTDSPSCPPNFNVTESKCWTGKIPETARCRAEARRSLHPTHSVSVIGSLKEELTGQHEKGSSPCDEYSPYYKNCIGGGYILLIGVDQESNTTIHCCEEIAGVPYHLQKTSTEVRFQGYENNEIVVRNYLHDWYKPATDFMYLEPFLEEKKVMRTARIGDSCIRLINAYGMLEETVKLLRKDPEFLIRKV